MQGHGDLINSSPKDAYPTSRTKYFLYLFCSKVAMVSAYDQGREEIKSESFVVGLASSSVNQGFDHSQDIAAIVLDKRLLNKLLLHKLLDIVDL